MNNGPIREKKQAGAKADIDSVPNEFRLTPAQQERLLSLGRLAGGVVHELNNPLNAILMNAELGLMLLQRHQAAGGALGSATAESAAAENHAKLVLVLSTIAQEARRGGCLTNELLDFIRTRRAVPNASVNLIDVVRSARGLLGNSLRRSKITLELALDESLPPLPGNSMALSQAVANLISNAAAARASHILVRSARDADTASEVTAGGRFVLLSVSDNGERLSVDDCQQLLATTAHGGAPLRLSQRPGLGVGLIKAVVDDHRGALLVNRDAGVVIADQIPLSTQFTLRLPLA